MKTQPLINTLRRLVSEIELDKSRQRQGLRPFRPHDSNEITHIITNQVISPIIKDLCITTRRRISYQHGSSVGFYYLLVDGRRFTILYIPNPGSGTILLKPLNWHGNQCAPTLPLNDTSVIVALLENFKDQ